MPFWRKKEQRATAEDTLLSVLMGRCAVTREMALQVPTVAGGIDLIANIIAGTPIKLYKDVQGAKAQEITDDHRLRLLNDETGDTLNANQFWRAMVRDYYLGKGGYAYISRQGTSVVSLHYVEEGRVTVLKNTDAIFKDFDLCVDGVRYRPFEFLKVLRNTTDGAQGVPMTVESAKLIETAYTSMVFERNMVRRGGNKKGFLKSESKLDPDSLSELRRAFSRLYSADSEGSDNFVVLNKGIDPEHFRLAAFRGPLRFEPGFLCGSATFALSFDCAPQRFLKSGELPVIFSEPGVLYNSTAFVSKPLIAVTGSGAGSLTVNDVTVGILSLDGSLTLDCDTQNAYSGYQNKNSTISAPVFPVLSPGENQISWTGGVTGVEITPRWWTL